MDARRPDLVAADAAETDAIQRYLRQRRFTDLLGDVVARAEARCRLESALRLLTREH
jgi:uncharacterized protein YqeY